MLVEFGAKNFFSFKEGFSVSFKLGSSCPEHISNGNEISNVMCIKGANGSGKTNVLKAINFIFGFCKDSFNSKPEVKIGFDSFFNNEDVSDFYVKFYIENTLYTYEATLTEGKIISETLFRKEKREVKVFERNENIISNVIREFDAIKSIPKLRSNASLISTAHQFQINCLEPIYDFFSDAISNVFYFGMNDSIEIKKLTKFMHEHSDYYEFVKATVKKFDPGLHDLYLHESEAGDGEKTYTPWFVFKIDNNIKILSYSMQSSGTQSLYKQLCGYKTVLDNGALMIMDEFDINLHPHILPHLLDFFINPETNPNNAQIIFTTHNTEILDFLGRHRTCLVNKDNNESYLYRLDDIPGDILRNDRAISPAYNLGKIGGVPKI
ncbi:MAG: ATP-binding protein [Rouxiella badensis]|uniref:AAA family ATPase n=1 Tax=Rouxiella badensis TaxID=1646377 RepID=UPI003C4B84D2